MRKIEIINENGKANEENNYENNLYIKNCKHHKEIIKICSKNVPIIIGFILAYWLYFLSLEACFEGEGRCSTYVDWIKKKLFEEAISCFVFSIMFQLLILKKISKKHMIHILIFFLFFYWYSHGIVFENHGYFNFTFYCIIVAIFTLIMLPFDIIVLFMEKTNIIKIVLIYLCSLFFFIIIFVYYLFNYKSNCSDWSKGLNNTYIENNTTKHGCQIQIPTKCTYKIFKYVQDYTKFTGKDCKTFNNKELKRTLLRTARSPYINKTSRRVGFPLTNRDRECLNDFGNYNHIYKYVFDNIVDMDNKELLDKYYKEKMPEIEINFCNNDKGKIIIDLKFNKTLSEERKLLENNSEPYSKNILLLFIDSLSRANAIRQLKKTLKFFEKFMPYNGGFNKKYPSEKFHSFQFFKYHSFYGYTFYNYPLLFYGQRKENRNKTSITKFLRENGYITCNAHDCCKIDNTRMYHNFSLEEAFDHQYLICDPNNEEISINTIRCLYDKQNIEHLLNYTEQFWRKYKNNRKYASLLINHGHEGTLTVIKYQDDIIADFLYRLFNDNLLKDTSIILLSDHGIGMPSIYYIYDFYLTEMHLPSFFIITNDRKNLTYEEQYKLILENQQTFITAFDIYNTIGNIIYGDKYINIPNKTSNMDSSKSPFGISLFNKINPKERSPKNYTSYSGMNVNVCI